MSAIPRIPLLGAILAAALAATGSASLAQPQRPDDAQGPPQKLPFTPKGARGAYNFGGTDKEGPGETTTFKSARAQYEALKKQAGANGASCRGPSCRTGAGCGAWTAGPSTGTRAWRATRRTTARCRRATRSSTTRP